MLYVCEIIDFSRLNRSQNIFRYSEVYRSHAQVFCLSDCVIVFFAVPLDYVKMAVIFFTETLCLLIIFTSAAFLSNIAAVEEV